MSKISYKPLWKILIDKDMKKKDLVETANISNVTLNKLSHNGTVTTETLLKIANYEMLKNYYYNKLSIEERKTYDSMLKGYLARKRLINITSFPTQNVVEALNNEHPELFYVRINRILSCTGISGDSYIKPEYLYSKKEEENILAKARNITEQLKNNDEEMTVRSVHNFFVKHISMRKI